MLRAVLLGVGVVYLGGVAYYAHLRWQRGSPDVLQMAAVWPLYPLMPHK